MYLLKIMFSQSWYMYSCCNIIFLLVYSHVLTALCPIYVKKYASQILLTLFHVVYMYSLKLYISLNNQSTKCSFNNSQWCSLVDKYAG